MAPKSGSARAMRLLSLRFGLKIGRLCRLSWHFRRNGTGRAAWSRAAPAYFIHRSMRSMMGLALLASSAPRCSVACKSWNSRHWVRWPDIVQVLPNASVSGVLSAKNGGVNGIHLAALVWLRDSLLGRCQQSRPLCWRMVPGRAFAWPVCPACGRLDVITGARCGRPNAKHARKMPRLSRVNFERGENLQALPLQIGPSVRNRAA